jgi:hypothetical protein
LCGFVEPAKRTKPVFFVTPVTVNRITRVTMSLFITRKREVVAIAEIPMVRLNF